ncbi:hypothetical protein K438DRAFT_1772548 [Mycena galopus ATCC 62051]|nr:hypothetical protein K438DRAFT_1772548 [Mycena galopus ATCC 62051]
MGSIGDNGGDRGGGYTLNSVRQPPSNMLDRILIRASPPWKNSKTIIKFLRAALDASNTSSPYITYRIKKIKAPNVSMKRRSATKAPATKETSGRYAPTRSVPARTRSRAKNQGIEPPPEDADEDEDGDAAAEETYSRYAPTRSVPAQTCSRAKIIIPWKNQDGDEDKDRDAAAKGTGRHAPTRSVFARTGSRPKKNQGVALFPEDVDKEEDEEDGQADAANETGGPADTPAVTAREPQGTDPVAASETSGAPAGTSSKTTQRRGTGEVAPRPKPKPCTKQVASPSKDPFDLFGRRGACESTTRPVPVNDDSSTRDQFIKELEATDARYHEGLVNFQADLRADSQRLRKEIDAMRADSNTLTRDRANPLPISTAYSCVIPTTSFPLTYSAANSSFVPHRSCPLTFATTKPSVVATPPTPPGEFPPVVHNSNQKPGESMEAFFERRSKADAQALACETDRQRQSRLAKEKNSQRKACPSKARVYVWEKINGHWIRRPAGQEKEDLWDEHSSSQRRYNSFCDEWDLCVKWGPEDLPNLEEDKELLEDAGHLYPVKMVTDLLGPSNNTVKKTLFAYQPIRTGDPNHDPVYQPITNETPILQRALYYRFGLFGEKHWRVPPRLPSVKTVQNLVGLPTATILPVMQTFFGQCMDPEAQHLGLIDRKLLDFHQNPTYAQPENRYFDLLYEELWNQHETSRPLTAGNMLDEVRVNYYVLRERGKPLIDSRVLLMESPTDVFEILRQRWGPTIDDVAERLVSRGMSFHLALTQLNFQLLHRRRGSIALQYGGLVARLARPEAFLNELLHNFDNGIPEFADCLWNRRSNYAYWFQGLAQSEIELLCGVYHMATGKTDQRKDGTIAVALNTGGLSEQTRQISWWPTPSAWQSGGLYPGWWSPPCEDWFLKKRSQYESGKSFRLSTNIQWKSNIKFDKNLRPTLAAHEKISATMFQRLHSPRSF